MKSDIVEWLPYIVSGAVVIVLAYLAIFTEPKKKGEAHK